MKTKDLKNLEELRKEIQNRINTAKADAVSDAENRVNVEGKRILEEIDGILEVGKLDLPLDLTKFDEVTRIDFESRSNNNEMDISIDGYRKGQLQFEKGKYRAFILVKRTGDLP